MLISAGTDQSIAHNREFEPGLAECVVHPFVDKRRFRD